MIALRSISQQGFVYNLIIGTGGIGSGISFSIKGNETIGRNESRMATLLPCKDYCKQHIILHYMAVLLGAKAGGEFQCYPIGKVGNDEPGKNLLSMMKSAGMDITNVGICGDRSTLFSVCYQYPDYSGGNITTSESASSLVSAGDISKFFDRFILNGRNEIIVAVPEVPVETRIKLLGYGRLRRSLNVASVLSPEIEEFKNLGGFSLTDILAVNIDEATGIGGIEKDDDAIETIIETCIRNLKEINSSITILITCGSKGVYCYSNNLVEFTPALKVPVISTAGAGDAFLAGFLCGVCCGLPYFKGASDDHFAATPVASAVELGILLASMSVTSSDTINVVANAGTLFNFIAENNINLSPDALKIFSDQITHAKILN